MRQILVLAGCLILTACGGGSESSGPGIDAGAPSAVASDTAARVEASAAVHEDDAAETPDAQAEPAPPVIAQALAYGAAAQRNLIGYLAMPEDVIEPLPGVIIIHERWGLDDNIKAAARRLAGAGYVVLAIDLYGGATTTEPDEAERLMTATLTDPEAALSNIRQAHDYLTNYALAPKVAVLGFGLGGSWSLRAGLDAADGFDAIVMYYGQVVTNAAELEQLRAPLLGLFGDSDEVIPVGAVRAFREALDRLGNTADIHVYAGAGHAFANPGSGNYHATAADDAWIRTLTFFDAHLRADGALTSALGRR